MSDATMEFLVDVVAKRGNVDMSDLIKNLDAEFRRAEAKMPKSVATLTPRVDLDPKFATNLRHQLEGALSSISEVKGVEGATVELHRYIAALKDLEKQYLSTHRVAQQKGLTEINRQIRGQIEPLKKRKAVARAALAYPERSTEADQSAALIDLQRISAEMAHIDATLGKRRRAIQGELAQIRTAMTALDAANLQASKAIVRDADRGARAQIAAQEKVQRQRTTANAKVQQTSIGNRLQALTDLRLARETLGGRAITELDSVAQQEVRDALARAKQASTPKGKNEEFRAAQRTLNQDVIDLQSVINEQAGLAKKRVSDLAKQAKTDAAVEAKRANLLAGREEASARLLAARKRFVDLTGQSLSIANPLESKQLTFDLAKLKKELTAVGKLAREVGFQPAIDSAERLERDLIKIRVTGDKALKDSGLNEFGRTPAQQEIRDRKARQLRKARAALWEKEHQRAVDAELGKQESLRLSAARQAQELLGQEAIDRVGGTRGVGHLSREELIPAQAYLEDSIKALEAEKVAVASSVKPLVEKQAALKKLNATQADHVAALRTVKQELNGYTGFMRQAALAMKAFFRYAILYGAGFKALQMLSELPKGILELDKALRSIQAVAQATNEQLGQIGVAIKSIAAETKFSVKEVATAAQVLAQAGISPDQLPSALKNTINYAAATNTTPEVAADTVTSMRNTFWGDQGQEAIDAFHTAADQLTAAVNISKLTAEGLKTIISLGAQPAKAYGLSSAQFLGTAATLSNLGVKDSTIATGTRQLLADLLSPSGKTIRTLSDLYRQRGDSKSDNEIKALFQSFQRAANPLVAVLTELKNLGVFGANANKFRGVIEKRAENILYALGPNLATLQENIQKELIPNAAAQGAAVQMQAVTNAFESLKSSAIGLSHTLTESLLPSLASMGRGLASFVGRLRDAAIARQAQEGVSPVTDVTRGALGAVAGGALAGRFGKGVIGKGVAGIGGAVAGAFGGFGLESALPGLTGRVRQVISFLTDSFLGIAALLPLVRGLFTVAKAGTPVGQAITGLIAITTLLYNAYDKFAGNPDAEKLAGLKAQQAARAQKDEERRQQFLPFDLEAQGSAPQELSKILYTLKPGASADTIEQARNSLRGASRTMLDQVNLALSRDDADRSDAEKAMLDVYRTAKGSSIFSGNPSENLDTLRVQVERMMRFYEQVLERQPKEAAAAIDGLLKGVEDKELVKLLGRTSEDAQRFTTWVSLAIHDGLMDRLSRLAAALSKQIGKARWAHEDQEATRLQKMYDQVVGGIPLARENAAFIERNKQVAEETRKQQVADEEAEVSKAEAGSAVAAATEQRDLAKARLERRQKTGTPEAASKSALELGAAEESLNRQIYQKEIAEGKNRELAELEYRARREQIEEQTKTLLHQKGVGKATEKNQKETEKQQNKLESISKALDTARERYTKANEKLASAKADQLSGRQQVSELENRLKNRDIPAGDQIKSRITLAEKQLKGGAGKDAADTAMKVLQDIVAQSESGELGSFDAESLFRQAKKVQEAGSQQEVDVAQRQKTLAGNRLASLESDAATVQDKLKDLNTEAEKLAKIKVGFDTSEIDAQAVELGKKLQEALPNIKIGKPGEEEGPPATQLPGGQEFVGPLPEGAQPVPAAGEPASVIPSVPQLPKDLVTRAATVPADALDVNQFKRNPGDSVDLSNRSTARAATAETLGRYELLLNLGGQETLLYGDADAIDAVRRAHDMQATKEGRRR